MTPTNPPSMDRDAVLSTLRAQEFSAHGYCNTCAGWMVSPNGETRKAHTEDCSYVKAINAVAALYAQRDGLDKALRNVLATGLNGANNIRLALIAAGGKELGADDLARAEKSEEAVLEASAALARSTP